MNNLIKVQDNALIISATLVNPYAEDNEVEICDIAIIDMKGNKLFYSSIFTVAKIMPDMERQTGYTINDINNAPTFDKIHEKIIPLLKGNTPIIYATGNKLEIRAMYNMAVKCNVEDADIYKKLFDITTDISMSYSAIYAKPNKHQPKKQHILDCFKQQDISIGDVKYAKPKALGVLELIKLDNIKTYAQPDAVEALKIVDGAAIERKNKLFDIVAEAVEHFEIDGVKLNDKYSAMVSIPTIEEIKTKSDKEIEGIILYNMKSLLNKQLSEVEAQKETTLPYNITGKNQKTIEYIIKLVTDKFPTVKFEKI